MDPIRFAIIGGGWRAQCYLRVARALPERFEVSGVLTTSSATRVALAHDFGVSTPESLDDLLASDPTFVVLSVPWKTTPVLLEELTSRGIPCLAETPPAPDIGGLRGLKSLADRGARIQVAEQYQFQPHHAARIVVARSGRLGTISQAQVSAAHGYHGIDLLRRLLDDRFGPVSIRARRFESTIVDGPGRAGPPREEKVVPSEQVIATLEFDGQLGVFDFTEDQYFSYIRSHRLLVRGERGEIHDMTVRYLEDATTPVTMEFRRHEMGQDSNLEGLGFIGITLGPEWVVRTEFPGASLADDDLAIAICLVRMAEYIGGGPGFCDLAEGVHDHHLGLMIGEAVASGAAVEVPGHLWDEGA
jgi:predicted dehydrogenase